MAELGSHDTSHPWSLLQELLLGEVLRKQLALVSRYLSCWGPSKAGHRFREGTTDRAEGNEHRPSSSPLFLLPGIPAESPAASSAWAGSALVGRWS